jgi:hypothetical protein
MDIHKDSRHKASEQRVGMPLPKRTYGEEVHLHDLKNAISSLDIPVTDSKSVLMAKNANKTIDDAISRHRDGDGNGASMQAHATARQIMDLSNHLSKNFGATDSRELYSGYRAADHANDYTDTVVQAKDDEFRFGGNI